MRLTVARTQRHRLDAVKFPMFSDDWTWQGVCHDLNHLGFVGSEFSTPPILPTLHMSTVHYIVSIDIECVRKERRTNIGSL